jgi:hypothetical protein
VIASEDSSLNVSGEKASTPLLNGGSIIEDSSIFNYKSSNMMNQPADEATKAMLVKTLRKTVESSVIAINDKLIML